MSLNANIKTTRYSTQLDSVVGYSNGTVVSLEFTNTQAHLPSWGNASILTLPSQLRPPTSFWFSQPNDVNVRIGDDGIVSVYNGNGNERDIALLTSFTYIRAN